MSRISARSISARMRRGIVAGSALLLVSAGTATAAVVAGANPGASAGELVRATQVVEGSVPAGVALWQLTDGPTTFASVEVPMHRPPDATTTAHSLVIALGDGAIADATAWSGLVATGGFVVAIPTAAETASSLPPLLHFAHLVTRLVPGFAVDRVYLVATDAATSEALSLLISHPLVFSGAALFPGRVSATTDVAPALATIRIPVELWAPPDSGWRTLYRHVQRLGGDVPVRLRASPGAAAATVARALPAALLDLGLLTPEQTEPLQPAPAVAMNWHRAAAPSCGRRAPTSYSWPLRPFDRPHPVRGGFGDPRTVFGLGTPADASAAQSAAFHDGIDISAPGGARVYPVVSGVVSRARGDTVVVRTSDRTFVYRHIHPAVARGRRVVARVTVLGRVSAVRKHLHFTEIDGIRVADPLAPGHLYPVVDRTPPTVAATLARSSSGNPLDPETLTGRFELDALAFDTPSMRVPGPWSGMPTAPALVRWRLVRADGTTVAAGTAADFRQTLPLPRSFRRVYAPGTYQNFPVIGLHWFKRTRGRYLFRLTPKPLDAAGLGAGDYRLTVTAADVCGNSGSLTTALHVAAAD